MPRHRRVSDPRAEGPGVDAARRGEVQPHARLRATGCHTHGGIPALDSEADQMSLVVRAVTATLAFVPFAAVGQVTINDVSLTTVAEGQAYNQADKVLGAREGQ